MKRYWVQTGEVNNRVTLKTNELNRAIDKMKHATKKVFIWDCIYRKLVDANYDCKIL